MTIVHVQLCMCHCAHAIVPVQLCLCHCAHAIMPVQPCLCHHAHAIVPVPLCPCHCACASCLCHNACVIDLRHCACAIVPLPSCLLTRNNSSIWLFWWWTFTLLMKTRWGSKYAFSGWDSLILPNSIAHFGWPGEMGWVPNHIPDSWQWPVDPSGNTLWWCWGCDST